MAAPSFLYKYLKRGWNEELKHNDPNQRLGIWNSGKKYLQKP